MYLISIIIFFIILCITFLASNMPVASLLDAISILAITLSVIPLLTAAGMEKDFLRSFSVITGKAAALSKKQLRRCREALSLVLKLLLCSGTLFTFLYLISLLRMNIRPEQLAPNVAVASLTILYALLLCLLLLPIYSRIQTELINREEAYGEETGKAPETETEELHQEK